MPGPACPNPDCALDRRRALKRLAAATGLVGGCASLTPGPTVTLGGRQVAYSRAGQGLPVVVLQSGLGDDRSPWSAVQAQLQLHHTVLSYDRPGYGGSDSVDGPRDACAIATELRAVLAALGLPPPYLLVGHSLGGLYQHAFARLYPQAVAGLVLLDPTHPRHWATLQADVPATAATLKVLRATVFAAAARREFDEQGGCLQRLEGAPAQPVPTRLLASTQAAALEGPDFQRLLERLRDDWQRLTGAAAWQRVPGAGHYIQRDSPQAVVRAVRELAGAR